MVDPHIYATPVQDHHPDYDPEVERGGEDSESADQIFTCLKPLQEMTPWVLVISTATILLSGFLVIVVLFSGGSAAGLLFIVPLLAGFFMSRGSYKVRRAYKTLSVSTLRRGFDSYLVAAVLWAIVFGFYLILFLVGGMNV